MQPARTRLTVEGAIIETMFCVIDKQSRASIPFILNPTQRKLDLGLGRRNFITKARQEGVTSYILARFNVACMTKKNTRAVVISHERESTERMLDTVHGFIDNIRGPKPVIENSSKSEITFPRTNSMFYIGTAGAKAFGRGDTITHFHGSEVAFWENPQVLLHGALQAVPDLGDNEVYLESTGNGAGTWFHQQVMQADRGNTAYKLHFFNWTDFPEYNWPVTPEQAQIILSDLREEYEEPELVHEHGLTAGQILFRRNKLASPGMDFDLTLFKQEYPLTLDECFRATGSSFFSKVKLISTQYWKEARPHYRKLEHHPVSGFHYALGADTSAGVGKDSSVIEVICFETNEQVAEYTNKRISPEVLANEIATIGKEFNNAYVVVESNNHGVVTLDNLRKMYSLADLHRDRPQNNNLVNMGYRTSARSKPYVCGDLRTRLAQGLVIHSDLLRNELLTFIEDENGKLSAAPGCHDDCVMALAMATVGLPRAAIRAGHRVYIDSVTDPDPFSFEAIFDERERGKFPIAPQHASSMEGLI